MLEIRIHGRGGQGGVTAVNIFGDAAVKDGNCAQAFPSFGPERRGAPVLAFCKIDKDFIRDRSQVTNPDVVVVFDEGLVSMVNVTAGLKKQGTVVINTEKAPDSFSFSKDFKVITVDATSISLKHLGRPIVNTTIMGAVCAATAAVDIQSLKQAVLENFEGSLGEKNVKALTEAYEQCKGGC